jgi:TRAP-type uncharacterized transport system fused permease subunit
MRFGWSAYVIPVLFAFSPTLILIGEPGEIALAVITAVMGVWLVSSALAGYLIGRLGTGNRVLFAVAGLMALVPAGAFAGAIYTDIAGVALGAVLISAEMVRARRIPAGEAGG